MTLNSLKGLLKCSELILIQSYISLNKIEYCPIKDLIKCTFTWNEVVLRSNVLLRYFILWRSISLLSNFCLILRDLFLIYFNFGIGNTGVCTAEYHGTTEYQSYLFLNCHIKNGYFLKHNQD